MNPGAIAGKAPLVRLLLITGAFLVFIPRLSAQYDFNQNCQAAYHAVLSLQFGEAHRLLDQEKKHDPANLIPVYLENYIDFLTLFIGEDRRMYEVLKDRRAGRVRLLENGSKDSPYRNFCLAEVHIQWAFSRIKFGDYTAAAFEIRKAHALFTDNAARYPSFTVNRIGLGLVHVVVGLVPESYQWVTDIMGVDGSVEKGLEEIRQVAEYDGPDRVARMYGPEAAFYLAFLAANLQKDKKEALPVLRLMEPRGNSPHAMESPLMIFARATILSKNGRNDEALAVLQERHHLTGRFPFHYLDYLEGMARLNKLDYSAAEYFERFTVNFRGTNYIRSAIQKMAWIALLQCDTLRYAATMKRVAGQGNPVTDEDRQALNEAGQGVPPNARLLRGRLLFDGGYYSLALDELLGTSIHGFIRTKRDLVEYSYRLGRIYHESGNYPKAVEYYRQAIRQGRTEPWYYAAGAAYQTGLLYENAGEWNRADSAYRLCLSINTPEYKTSLGQKARAGLNRVKKNVPKT